MLIMMQKRRKAQASIQWTLLAGSPFYAKLIRYTGLALSRPFYTYIYQSRMKHMTSLAFQINKFYRCSDGKHITAHKIHRSARGHLWIQALPLVTVFVFLVKENWIREETDKFILLKQVSLQRFEEVMQKGRGKSCSSML